ncbi:MAG: alpha/beta hydrolase [Pseudomonadota bacterium]
MTWTTRPRSEIAGLAACVAGAGPNILLLHGVGLRAEAWGAQIDVLASSLRVTAPDMPGHGESTLQQTDLALADYVDAVAGVLETLEGPTVLAGHSMGAMLALAVAAQYPQRIVGVVALNAVFERSEAAAQAVEARAASLDGVTPADPRMTLERWFGTAASPERAACQSWLTSIDPKGYKLAYTAFAHSRFPDRVSLEKLTCPALFVTGSLEPNATPKMSQAMAALAPKGSAHIVEGAAHMMPMTHQDEVNASLIAFAKRVLS